MQYDYWARAEDMTVKQNPSTRNRTRDHLIAAVFYSQVLCQLSYRRLVYACAHAHLVEVRACQFECFSSMRVVEFVRYAKEGY